jgi:hypothetical protein
VGSERDPQADAVCGVRGVARLTGVLPEFGIFWWLGCHQCEVLCFRVQEAGKPWLLNTREVHKVGAGPELVVDVAAVAVLQVTTRNVNEATLGNNGGWGAVVGWRTGQGS